MRERERGRERGGSLSFELSQTLWIIPGLSRLSYRDRRTNIAKIRREEQREKAENCREKMWNEIQLKGP